VSRRAAALATAGVGFGLARTVYGLLVRRPPGGAGRWTRTNHRGDDVTLLEGPAVAVATAVAALLGRGLPGRLRAAAALAAFGAGAFGVLDDLAEQGASKGLRGHLGALGRGELTTGGVKILGIGATGLVAAALATPRGSGPESGAGRSAGVGRGAGGGRGAGVGRAAGGGRGAGVGRALDVAVAGALIAGSANLLNLFDLRPGRALKVALLAAPAVLVVGSGAGLAAAAVGPAASVLRVDLAEQAMLGDGGANALGAALGTALVAGSGRVTRLAALAAVLGLTLASEKVSFTAVIAATPGLREFDALGRRPAVR
jgi:UDP-GlcNAc:undecaprenyl-phosphate/decaprenyl-phosphate GlcNAc-1-phosphate transferase